jgi:hypothetical protein
MISSFFTIGLLVYPNVKTLSIKECRRSKGVGVCLDDSANLRAVTTAHVDGNGYII